MLIIGHRWQEHHQSGAEMIEVDLRLAKDGRIVVTHDPDPTGAYKDAPELREVLSEIRSPLNLEIKEPGFEARVLELIKDFPFKVLISSFKPQVVKKVRALNRDIKLGSIIDPDWKNYFFPLLILGLYLKIDSIHPHVSLVTGNRVWWMHRLGFKVYPWVVNSHQEFETVKNLQVDGVFTDRPDIIKE